MHVMLRLLLLVSLAQSWAVFANSPQELPHNQLLYIGQPVQYLPSAVHQNIATTTAGETQQLPSPPQYFPQLAQAEQPQAIRTQQQYQHFAQLPQSQHNPGNMEITVIKPSMFSSSYYYGPGQLNGFPSQSNVVPIGVQNSPEQYEVHVLDNDGIYQQFYQTSLKPTEPSRKSQFITAESTTTTSLTTSTPVPSNVPPRKSQLAFIIPEITTPKPIDPNQYSGRNNTGPSEKYLPPFEDLKDFEPDFQPADQITSASAIAQSSASRYHGPDHEYLPVTANDRKRITSSLIRTTQSQETVSHNHPNSQHPTATLRPSTGQHGYRYNTPAQRHPSPHAKTMYGVNYNELGMGLNITTETQQNFEYGSDAEEKTEIETQQGYAYGQPAASGGKAITHLKPVSTIPNSYHYYRPQQGFEESQLEQEIQKNQTQQQYERPTGSSDSLHYGYQSTSSVYPNSTGHRKTNYRLSENPEENFHRPLTQESPTGSVPNGQQYDPNLYPYRFDNEKIQHDNNPSQFKQNPKETSKPTGDKTTPQQFSSFQGNYGPESRPISDNPSSFSGNVYPPKYSNDLNRNPESILQPETGGNSAPESSKPQPTLSPNRPGISSEQESSKPQPTLSPYRPGGTLEHEFSRPQPTLSHYRPGSVELNVNYNPQNTHPETTGNFRPLSDTTPAERPLYETGYSEITFQPNSYPSRPESAEHNQNYNSISSQQSISGNFDSLSQESEQQRPSSQFGQYEHSSRPNQHLNRPESGEDKESIKQRPSSQSGQYEQSSISIQHPSRPETEEYNKLEQQRLSSQSGQYEHTSRPNQHSNRPGSEESNQSVQQRPSFQSGQYEHSSRPIQHPNRPESGAGNESIQQRPSSQFGQSYQPSGPIQYPNGHGSEKVNEHYNSSASEILAQRKPLSETGQNGQHINPTLHPRRPVKEEVNVNLPSSPNFQQQPNGNFQPSLQQYKPLSDRQRYEQQHRPTLNPGASGNGQFYNDQAIGKPEPSHQIPSWGSGEYNSSFQELRPTLNPGTNGNGQYNNGQANGNTVPSQQRPSTHQQYVPSSDRGQYEQQHRPTWNPAPSGGGQFNNGQANGITGQNPSLGPKEYDALTLQQGNSYNPIQQYVPALDNSQSTLSTNVLGSKDAVQQVYPFTNFKPIGSDETSTNSQHSTALDDQHIGLKGNLSSLPTWNQNFLSQTKNPLSSNAQPQPVPAKVIPLPLGLLPPIANVTGLSDSSLVRPIQDSNSYSNYQNFNSRPESQTQVQRFPNPNQVSPLSQFSTNQANLDQSRPSSNEITALYSSKKEPTSLLNKELVDFPLNRGNLAQFLSSAQKTTTSEIDQPQRTGDIYSQVSHSVGDTVSQGSLQLQDNHQSNSLSEANVGYRQPRLPQNSFSTGIANHIGSDNLQGLHQGQLPQSSSSFNPHYSSTGWLPIQPTNPTVPKANYPTFQHQQGINGNALLMVDNQRVKPLQQQLSSPATIPLTPTAAQESSGTLSAEAEYRKHLTKPKQFSQHSGTNENSQLFLAKPTKTSSVHSAGAVSNFFSPSGSLSNTAPSTSANKGHLDLNNPFNGQTQSLATPENTNLLQMPSHSYSYTMHPGHLNHGGQSSSRPNPNSNHEGRPISKPMIFVETPESATTAAATTKPMVFTEASINVQQPAMIQPRSLYGAMFQEPSNSYLPHSVMSGSPYHKKK